MRKVSGVLTISIDFELHWGVSHLSVSAYERNLRGARVVVPRLLELFSRGGIPVTWATVGFLCCGSKDELMAALPAVENDYYRENLLSDRFMSTLGKNETEDPFHYAASLVAQIVNTPGQELGTHTLSHFHCLAPGASPEAFQADLKAALDLARRKYGRLIKSIVFPRNQMSAPFLEICADLGIMAYRGVEPAWPYTPSSGDGLIKRAVRLADSCIDLTGHHTGDLVPLCSSLPVNVPSSAFLRPVGRGLEWRLRRIEAKMEYAARHGRLCHIWWHPHNFGGDVETSMAMLMRLLFRFRQLSDDYGMRAMSMESVATEMLGVSGSNPVGDYEASGGRGAHQSWRG